jgi:hypothetical protein
MTIDEARACLARGEPDVLYRPAHGEPEHGVITSVTEAWVFVRYGAQATPAATDPADLEPLTPEQARRWLWRRPLRTGGTND